MKTLPIFALILLTQLPAFTQNLTELGILDLGKDSRFGQSVELTNDHAFIGAPFVTIDSIRARGAVYVFEKSITWDSSFTLLDPEGRPFDRFGQSLSATGDLLAVGAPGRGSGIVYLYKRQGTTWQLTQTLIPQQSEHEFFNAMEFGSQVKLTVG